MCSAQNKLQNEIKKPEMTGFDVSLNGEQISSCLLMNPLQMREKWIENLDGRQLAFPAQKLAQQNVLNDGLSFLLTLLMDTSLGILYMVPIQLNCSILLLNNMYSHFAINIQGADQ